MRTTETTRPTDWPSVEELRKKVDDRIQERGEYASRGEALHAIGMTHAGLDRLLDEGLSKNPRAGTPKKLRRIGVLDIIPRR